MQPEKPSTIILDIDGVIIPDFHSYDMYADDEDAPNAPDNPNKDLGQKTLLYGEVYYPEVVDKLAQLATRATIALGSSRQLSFLIPRTYADITQPLGIKGALMIDAFRPAKISYKYDAVRRFAHNSSGEDLGIDAKYRGRVIAPNGSDIPGLGRNVVWVDDHIPRLRYSIDDEAEGERLDNELHNDAKIATVVPKSRVGLTLADVDAIAKKLM